MAKLVVAIPSHFSLWPRESKSVECYYIWASRIVSELNAILTIEFLVSVGMSSAITLGKLEAIVALVSPVVRSDN